MTQTRILTLIATTAFLALIFSAGCTKNPVTPPVHDTVTVVKHDTTTNIDTLYANKPDSTVDLTKGLLVYLPFSGNIADSSGNGNQTTAYGSVLTYDAHGYANNAFGATGNGERIYVSNNGSIKFDTAFSLSFGFMVNNTRTQTYMSMVDPATGQGPSFIIGTTLPAAPYLLDLGIGDAGVGCGNIGQIDDYSICDTANWTPVPGSWYNLIAIYHNGSTQIYVNGTLISSKAGKGHAVMCCPASKIVIGSWWDGNPPNQSQNLNGKMDNIRLYNRVLTPHEIAVLSSNYQVTSNGVRPRLKAH